MQCNFRNVNKNGSYARVRAHLLKIKGEGVEVCYKVTSKDIAEFQRLTISNKESSDATLYSTFLPYHLLALVSNFQSIMRGLGIRKEVVKH